jgi:hypothetical protein
MAGDDRDGLEPTAVMDSRVAVAVHFDISLTDRFGGGGAPIVFNRWLPRGPENGIKFTHGSCSGLLWFETKSAGWIHDEAGIEQTINVQAESAFAEVVTKVEAAFAAWMQNRDCSHPPPPEEQDLSRRYEQHGHIVLAALNHGLNRFLSFVRIEKGQYGVQQKVLGDDRLSSHAVATNARAKVGDGEWFRWCPTHVISLTARASSDNDPRFLRPADWPRVQEFVSSNRKPTLTLELMAGAEGLADEGSDRAALTEAVAAVEVAIAKFVPSPQAAGKLPDAVRSRLGTSSLRRLADTLGLRGTVAVLLPFLLPAEELPADLLRTCADAISERQTVIHKGQREVVPARLRQHLVSLRRLCELLLRHADIGAEGMPHGVPTATAHEPTSPNDAEREEGNS